ncbi:hypothetical protein GCM10009789_05040 [Kribbella sancticallisti]|uniref:EcsC protein family protein n=1 Tax=Kribbella sancticallisti TaxID=460087 RepID=A0ABN2CAZ3_9ACTN
MATEMTPYDRDAWAEVEMWRRRRLESQTRHLLPETLRRRMSKAGQIARARFESIPGAAEFEASFVKALGGLLDFGSRAAMATVGHEAIVEAYRKRGHEVADIDDIGKLELCEMDKVRPNLGLAYTAAATVEGAAAGFAVSGGQIIAAGGSVLGAGVGGAPGIGTVVGVMAADAAAVLVAANRAVAHIAAYYGYDVDHPDERLFALGVLSVGTATEAGKAAAYIELNKLVQALARRATWDQLRQNAVTRVVEKVFTRLGYRITQRKLGQAVPVFGTVIGAGMNAHLLSSVTDDANHIYRERFLRDHYGLAHEPLATPPTNETDVVDLAEFLHEEVAKEDGLPTDGGDGQRS